MRSFLFFIFILFLPLLGVSQDTLPRYIPGEIYLKIKPSFSNLIKSNNATPNLRIELPFLNNRLINENKFVQKINKPFNSPKNKDFNNIIKLKFPQNENIDDLIQKLKDDGFYEYVEKVPMRYIIAIPNDPSYPVQWSLKKIKAAEAWDEAQGNAPIIVAVVDNAIQTNHEDLAANMVAGKDMSSLNDFDPNPPNASFSHGTHVAGIVAAVNNNAVGIASASNNKIKIMPIKATPDNGNPNGIYFGFEGITWAVDNGAKIINLSWGGAGFSQAEQEVIDHAFNQGVLVVAAAGNDNSEELNYPASYNHVISVASLDSTDIRSSFSSFGNKIDISAPGRGILSTLPFNIYGSFGGTSMATPLVASCLGYIWSSFPNMNIGELENLIKNTSDNINLQNPLLNGKLGSGRINLLNAVACKSLGIDTLTLKISPSRYFCEGDTVTISTTLVADTEYKWFKNNLELPSTGHIINSTQEGAFTLKVEKGNCKRTIHSEELIFNNIKSEIPMVNQISTFYCADQPDTLKINPIACDIPFVYNKSYAGPVVGYDFFEQSGPSPSVTFESTPGLIDSLEVTIVWQKKDGGSFNSCSTPDGGSIPFNEEVSFSVKSPSGKIVRLIATGTFARGNTTSGIVTQTFKMLASPIPANSLPLNGTFRPIDDFSILNKDVPNGKWELLAQDNAQIDPLCVSGFSIKIFTDIVNSQSSVSWWDSPSGGQLLSDNNLLIRNNLPVGKHSFYAQNICSGLCPSSRTISYINVENVPTLVAFPINDILISNSQAIEVVTAQNFEIIKNSNNLYNVNGINSNGNTFNYAISATGPHASPVSICDSVSYIILAMGCSGEVQWSNNQTQQAILVDNLRNNQSYSANCLKNWTCPTPPPAIFSFVKSNNNLNINNSTVGGNVNQNSYGQTIFSNQTIISNSKINYTAEKSIILSPGFNLEKGNVFKAQIGDCNNNQ